MYSNVHSTNYQAKLIGRLVRESITLIQKIPSKYMNTALPKKTNVRIFTTAQHSLRCRFLGRTQQALNVVFFTPTQHSLRFNTFYLRRHNTHYDSTSREIIHSLIFHPRT